MKNQPSKCIKFPNIIFDADSLQQNVNLETTLAVLQTTCAQIEEESEVIMLANCFFYIVKNS